MATGAQKEPFQEVKAETADLLRPNLRHYTTSLLLHSVGENKSHNQLRIKGNNLSVERVTKNSCSSSPQCEEPPRNSWKYLKSTLYEVNDLHWKEEAKVSGNGLLVLL